MTNATTMNARAKRSDGFIANVDVRQGVMGLCVLDGRNTAEKQIVDGSVLGATDFSIVTVGETNNVNAEFDLYPMFNGGLIGSAVHVTAAIGAVGKASIVDITSLLTEEQIGYMTEMRVVATSTPPDGDWKIFLSKKAPLR